MKTRVVQTMTSSYNVEIIFMEIFTIRQNVTAFIVIITFHLFIDFMKPFSFRAWQLIINTQYKRMKTILMTVECDSYQGMLKCLVHHFCHFTKNMTFPGSIVVNVFNH